MSKKNHRNKASAPAPQVDIKKSISLDDIQATRELLAVQERKNLETLLKSTDPYDIIKAQKYIQQIEQRTKPENKSFVFAPDDYMYNSLGYKNHPTSISYQTLRNMARVPMIRSIITTRVDQVARFSEPVTDEQQVGWTIRKKKSYFDDQTKKELTDTEKRHISDMIEFMLNCGADGTTWANDNFDSFLRKLTKDSLELDQMTFECVRNRRGQLIEYIPTDGATFRLAETFDDRDANDPMFNHNKYEQINGYFPSYVQVWENNAVKEFYPWELCFGIRNVSTSIYNNGYGISELEDMIQIITWMLYGMQYNGNFFKQGANPRGFLSIQGNLSDNALGEFKQAWRSTIAGVQNAHKTPIIDGNNKVEWIDLQHSNKDMEFQQWNDFLMVVACSVFKMDPSEVGYNLQKASSLFGQDGQKARLEHSASKGLYPLLKFIQRKINKYITSVLDKNYEFVFCGLEQEDKVEALDMDVKKATAGFVSLEDMFEKHTGRKLDMDKDTLINSVVQQIKQQQQFGSPESNQAVDDMTGDSAGNPYTEDVDKGEDPFLKGLNSYIDKKIIDINK